MSQNGKNPPMAAVPPPQMKMFITNVTALPMKVPGPDGEQPGVGLAIASGDLTVNCMFPAGQSQAICEVIMQAAIAAMEQESGIVMPSSLSMEELKKMIPGDEPTP